MAIDPEDLQQELTETNAVLDYRPELKYTPPPGTPSTTLGQPLPAGATTAQLPNHPVQDHALTLLATWNDLQSIGNWLNASLALYADHLAGVQVPIAQDVLQPDEQQALQSLIGKASLGFGDVLMAYNEPNSAGALQIKRLWDRYTYSTGAPIDHAFYFDLWRMNKFIYPYLVQNTQSLIRLTTFAILGASDQTTQDEQLQMLVTAASTSSHTLTYEQILPYVRLGDTLAAITSDMTYAINGIAGVIDQQSNAGPEQAALLQALSQKFNQDGSAGGSIRELIDVLQMIKTLYEVWQDSSFLSLDTLNGMLDRLAEQLLMWVLGEVTAIGAHVEAQLMVPVVQMTRKIDRLFGGQAPKAIDTFADNLVVLIDGVLGKFEHHLLEMYRHSKLHNSLVAKKTTKQAQNNTLRNLVKTIDLIIQALEVLDGEVAWGPIIDNITQGFNSAAMSLIQLPPAPASQLNRPSPDAGMPELVAGASSWRQVGPDSTPDTTASRLLEQIRRANGDGSIS